MWRDYFYLTAGLRDAMKLTHHAHWVVHVLDYVTSDNFVEFVISERIREIVKIVDHIRGRSRVNIHPDSPGGFVDTAADVEHSRLGRLGEDLTSLCLSLHCYGPTKAA